MNAWNSMLRLHWKAARWPLAPMILLSVGLPMMVLRTMELGTRVQFRGEVLPAEVLMYEQVWLPVFVLLAVTVGVLVALTAWSWDHQARHVYALSLPLSRGKYVLYKMSAGLVILALPVLALLAGTLVGLAFISVPVGLHAYPFSFTLRFLLACAVTYAAIFALASGTVRTTVIVLIVLIVVVVFGSIAITFLRNIWDLPFLRTPGELLFDAMLNWPGPFSVFGGSWMIIDA
jgi:hypothetical protein